jgi:hypothetical protein
MRGGDLRWLRLVRVDAAWRVEKFLLGALRG